MVTTSCKGHLARSPEGQVAASKGLLLLYRRVECTKTLGVSATLPLRTRDNMVFS